MNWLERNAQLLSEIQVSARLKKGEHVGSGSEATFTTLGSYHSAILGSELHLGLKNYRSRMNDLRAIDDLAFIRVVAEQLPHLKPELPIVFGLLRDGRTDKDLGVLMEDFSQGNRLRVVEVERRRSYYAQFLPRELVTLVGEFHDKEGEDYELAKACFMVGNDVQTARIRLGDFNTIRTHMPFKRRFEEVFPFDDLGEDFAPYTVTIDHDL